MNIYFISQMVNWIRYTYIIFYTLCVIKIKIVFHYHSLKSDIFIGLIPYLIIFYKKQILPGNQGGTHYITIIN